MSNIKKFVELAIEGGYVPESHPSIVKSFVEHIEIHLLSPLAWQAVGKVKDWKKGWETKTGADSMGHYHVGWLYQWHLFIDLLADSKHKDIESALGKILK